MDMWTGLWPCQGRRVAWERAWRGCGIGGWQGGRAGKCVSNNVFFAREMHKISGEFRQER